MKKKDNIERELDNTKCPNCGRYNHNNYVKRYGRCRCCKEILDEQANFKYTMIKKMHLFKKGQAGHLYKWDAYKEN